MCEGSSEPSEIATKLKIPEQGVIFLIDQMAREKKNKETGTKFRDDPRDPFFE